MNNNKNMHTFTHLEFFRILFRPFAPPFALLCSLLSSRIRARSARHIAVICKLSQNWCATCTSSVPLEFESSQLLAHAWATRCRIEFSD